MSNDHENNGRFDKLHHSQREEFASMKTILENGFTKVADAMDRHSDEIRALRDGGSLPVEIVNKLLDGRQAIVMKLTITACWIIMAVFITLLGLKQIFPRWIA